MHLLLHMNNTFNLNQWLLPGYNQSFCLLQLEDQVAFYVALTITDHRYCRHFGFFWRPIIV